MSAARRLYTAAERVRILGRGQLGARTKARPHPSCIASVNGSTSACSWAVLTTSTGRPCQSVVIGAWASLKGSSFSGGSYSRASHVCASESLTSKSGTPVPLMDSTAAPAARRASTTLALGGSSASGSFLGLETSGGWRSELSCLGLRLEKPVKPFVEPRASGLNPGVRRPCSLDASMSLTKLGNHPNPVNPKSYAAQAR